MNTLRAHGANPEKFYSSFGIKKPEIIHDFSTNTNALPWNGHISIDMKHTLSDYPDDEASDIRKILAEKNHCSEGNILVTNGANEAIYLIASYQGGIKNSVLHPVYGEYDRALESYGVKSEIIMSTTALTPGKETVWICNPCNPTGKFIPDCETEALFEKFPEKTFIIDEAYAEFMYNNKIETDYTKYSNAVVIRSLTKIYHLCGSRIGYVLASEQIIAKLKKRQPTWSVNSLAQQAALAFLKDTEFPEKTRAYYKEETPRLIAELKKAGYSVLPTSVNYFLVRTDDDMGFIKYMLERGIVVRHTRNFPGLNGKFVRIAARTREENDLLIKIMTEYRR